MVRAHCSAIVLSDARERCLILKKVLQTACPLVMTSSNIW
jgi:hypothetical protein